jgi:bla regulator protein BlaR1
MTDTLARLLLSVSDSALLMVVVKSTVALIAGLAAAQLARRSAASIRHAILAATFAATAALPIASLTLPAVAVPVPVVAAAVTPPAPPTNLPTNARPLPTNATTTARPMAISSSTLAAAVWLAGVVIFSWSFAAGVWQLRRIRRTALPWLEARTTIAALSADAGVHAHIDVLLHEELSAPVTCGFRHPAVILPPDAREWTSDALRRAFVHEIEHVRRRDWWTHLTARAVCGLYWFNPLVWIAYRQLSLEAEHACDDAVIGQAERTEYAEQLVRLARRMSARRAQPMLAMANRSDLSRRVTAVLDDRQPRGRAGIARASLAGLVAIVLAFAIAPLRVVGAANTLLVGDNAGGGQRRIGPILISRRDRALLEAAEDGDVEDMKSLVESGANVNASIPGDGSPLIAAARAGEMAAVLFLLDRGADPDLAVEGDGNPLIMAAGRGHLQIVELLLNRGASVDLMVRGDENALINASANGHLAVVKLLVARGADVNARVWVDSAFERPNGEWRSPLSVAERGRHGAIIDFLRSAGASQN